MKESGRSAEGMRTPRSEEKSPASVEISWPLDGTTAYGTLLTPPGPGPFPGVVMVAGSGPTDRDWNSPLMPGSNGSARLIAEALAAAGIASLRYDKRVAGPHARENLPVLIGKISLQSHLEEVAGAVSALASRPDSDPARIFALTSSEGALHALNYQVHDPAFPFAGLVLTGAPGRAVGAVGRSQVVAELSVLPGGAQMVAAYDAAIDRFLAGEAVEPDPSLPQMVQTLLQALSVPANLPFARELWVTDPTTWIAQVRVPMLVVIGRKDIQVDWQADGGPLQRAATGSIDVTFVFPENANHVLKFEPRPRGDLHLPQVTSAYNSPDAALDPEALEAILAWMKTHV